MLTKEDFIKFILEGSQSAVSQKQETSEESVLPEGFDGFGFGGEQTEDTATETSSFARDLMEASGFGNAQYLERSEVILGDDPAAKYLTEQVYYWPQTYDRPYQTLLFELDTIGSELLKTPLFRALKGQEILEDALSRLAQMSLKGFEQGGEKRTASVKQGRQTETLCIVSCPDDREETDTTVHLVCFGTVSADQNSLESFHIREASKYWEPQIRDDHLEKLYKRHFSKLVSDKWQDKWQNAFISGEERKLARELLEVCIESNVKDNEKRIQESVVELLEEIARSFGLRRKGGKGGRRLSAFDLPSDHDIGMDVENLEKHGGKNPFSGMTLRDEKSRLLGYIIYCLDDKKNAVELRNHLKVNNRFHNVLIIYPDGDHAELELWQGKVPLAGKLTKKGAAYHGEGEVVNLLSRFFVVSKAKVKNPTELAQELAYRARYLRKLAIKELAEEDDEGPLRKLYNAFKESLVHDQTKEEFADAFAQTLTYGLLTARWMGSEQLTKISERFTRKNALNYLPTTSNFLGELFETILLLKLNENRGRLLWLVDDIANLLDRIDVNHVFGDGDKDFDLATDPIIHFYEPFLYEYDQNLKNKRGVFFTPKSVVSFIVQSIHELLIKEFGLEDGLASTETWGEMLKRFPFIKLPEGVKESDLFVCILDPATGTGTFLYECIEIIEKTMKQKWCQQLKKNKDDPEVINYWSTYVSKYLIPRLYGYEIMMASYSISHLKIIFKLRETGYILNKNDRIHIYLTNTLDQSEEDKNYVKSLFASLAKEVIEVNQVKRNKRFTVIVGNPPYSKLSANRNCFAESILEPFKVAVREEKNLQPLSDDYIKFLGIAYCFSQKANVSIVGMITNRGYLTGLIHRGVRQVLQQYYSQSWIIDLHGDSKVGETVPNGYQNENVFDIQQGVAISIFVKNGLKNKETLHIDSWGTRQEKYCFLDELQINSNSWKNFYPEAPNYFFSEKPKGKTKILKTMLLNEVMTYTSTGIKTHRDNLVIDFQKETLIERMRNFINPVNSDEIVRATYFEKKKTGGIHLAGDTSAWSLQKSRVRIQKEANLDRFLHKVYYRPFDVRYIFYHRAVVDRGREEFMQNMFNGNNIGIVTTRQVPNTDFGHILVSKHMIEMKACSHDRGTNLFPLYIYNDNELFFDEKNESICQTILKWNYAML
jgi:type I restriction-modification system DNA methylase subunit